MLIFGSSLFNNLTSKFILKFVSITSKIVRINNKLQIIHRNLIALNKPFLFLNNTLGIIRTPKNKLTNLKSQFIKNVKSISLIRKGSMTNQKKKTIIKFLYLVLGNFLLLLKI